MKLGAVDFLEKPVDPHLLLERLHDICDSSQLGVVQPQFAENSTVSLQIYWNTVLKKVVIGSLDPTAIYINSKRL